MINLSSSQAIVLVKYKLKRLFNLLNTGLGLIEQSSATRSATGKKKSKGLVRTLFICFFLWIASGFYSCSNIQKMQVTLEQSQNPADQIQLPAWGCSASDEKNQKNGVKCKADFAPNNSFTHPKPINKAIAIQMFLLFLTVLLFNLSTGMRETTESDLEWLSTLPLKKSKLITIKIMEQAIVNSTGFIIMWPFMTAVINSRLFLTVYSIILGFFASAVFLIFESSIRTLFETTLRISIRPSIVRNIKAVLLLATVIMLFSLNYIDKQDRPHIIAWSVWSEFDFLGWTPMGLLTNIIKTDSWLFALKNLFLFSLQLVLVYVTTIQAVLHIIRKGVVANLGGESTRKNEINLRHPQRSSLVRQFLSTVQRRDLTLFFRDRSSLLVNVVVQILLPIAYLFLFHDHSGIFSNSTRLKDISALTFGASAFSLLSMFQLIAIEGKSLWLLYTFPKPIESILKEKFWVWLSISFVFPIIAFSFYFLHKGFFDLASFFQVVVVLIGVATLGLIAASFSVFIVDSPTELASIRPRTDYVYLYATLAPFYTYSLYSPSYWKKTVLVVLFTLTALSIYQKARDHLPYLLDPTALPKPVVSLSDGLIALLGFIVIQGYCEIALILSGKRISIENTFFAYTLAGFSTYCAVRLFYWRSKTSGVPKILGKNSAKSIAIGLTSGITLGILGLLYMELAKKLNMFPSLVSPKTVDWKVGQWWVYLAVFVAPLCEEFIFRGLVFRGLSRTFSKSTSIVLSAGLFAIAHPVEALVPVFIGGVVLAYVYSLTQTLLAPMVTHGVYNLIIISYGLGLIPSPSSI